MSHKKISLAPEFTTIWPEHRYGWKNAISYLQEQLHHPDGVPFYSYLDDKVAVRPISAPFVGVLHHPPFVPEHFKVWSLQQIFDTPQWRANSENCAGLYTLCNYTANFIRQYTDVPVETLSYVMQPDAQEWSFDAFSNDPRLIHVGYQFRRPETFWDIRLYQAAKKQVIHRSLTDEEFDDVMARSVVFLHLYDAGAVTTVMDCIARNTPIIVNRLPALEEYLGEFYPLFYDAKSQIPGLFRYDRIMLAYEYLRGMFKKHFTLEQFTRRMMFGDIYRKLPSCE